LLAFDSQTCPRSYVILTQSGDRANTTHKKMSTHQYYVILELERPKTIHALNRTVTGIGDPKLSHEAINDDDRFLHLLVE